MRSKRKNKQHYSRISEAATKALVQCHAIFTFSRLLTFMSCMVSENFDDSLQAPVVQKVDNAICRINRYPVGSVVCFVNTYPLDSDLSGG